MNFDKLKPTVVLFLVAFLGVSTFSQSLPLIENRPFKLERGSSFAASGHSQAKRTRTLNTRPKQIINDIKEAMAVIQQNGIGINAGDPLQETVEGMLRTLDPHSHYYTQSDWTELIDDYNNEYVGVGVSIISRQNGDSMRTYVVSTVPGSPAADAKMHYGDEIIRVGNIETRGKSSTEVSELIRGESGTRVTIQLKNSKDGSIRTSDLTRIKLPQPTVSTAFMVDESVGYIGLTHGFSFTTAAEVRAATAKLTEQGMTALVLDLRGNPGGILEQSVRVAEEFLPVGATIVSQRGKVPSDTRVWRSGKTEKLTIPLILLVDGETASASEVLAGAMQDNDRALIIGERTFGKGLVQNVIDLPDRTGLTLTAAQYYTPSGRSIQRDYSDGSLYNYYNHKNQTAAIDKPSYVAKTITERRVYGGNGIEPDIPFTPQKLDTPLIDLIAFYTALNVGKSQLSDDMVLAEFYAFAVSRGFSNNLGDGKNVLRVLKTESALAANGTLAGIRERIINDPAVGLAISEMARSSELYVKATQTRTANIAQNKKTR